MSVFDFNKKLLALRNADDAVKYGKFDDLTRGSGYFAYSRSLGGESVIVVCNFDKPSTIKGLPTGEYIFGNGGAARDANGKYAPYETAVFKVSRKM